VDKTIENPKKNLGDSIRQRLKNLSEKRNRPFDEILRYYAMERSVPMQRDFFSKVG